MAVGDSITSPLLNQVDVTIVLSHHGLADFIALKIVYFQQHVGKKASPLKGSCFQVIEPGIAEGLELWKPGHLSKRRHDHHTLEDVCSLLHDGFLQSKLGRKMSADSSL